MKMMFFCFFFCLPIKGGFVLAIMLLSAFFSTIFSYKLYYYLSIDLFLHHKKIKKELKKKECRAAT